jgi:hypothetical protein
MSDYFDTVEQQLRQALRRHTHLPWYARLRVRHPHALVAVVACISIAGPALAAAVSLSGGHTASIPLPRGGALCPVGYEYLAYASLKRVYPPNYPGALPRNARGTSCYVSEQAAQTDGYATAPTPVGDTRLGPLYVAGVSAGVRGTCQRARRLITVAVYCPRRLPVPWIGSNGNDCPRTQCPLLRITGTFRAPSSYVGSAPGEGEMTVWAASAKQQAVYDLGCLPGARPISHAVLDGRAATWYECPILADITSAVLEWRVGSEVYGITASGPADLSRRLVEYVAAHLTRLAPTP